MGTRERGGARRLRLVAARGPSVTHVTPAVVAELVHDFDALPFASLPDYVSPPMTDGPTVTLQRGWSLVHEDVGDPAVPPALTALEQHLDQLAGVTASAERGTCATTARSRRRCSTRASCSRPRPATIVEVRARVTTVTTLATPAAKRATVVRFARATHP